MKRESFLAMCLLESIEDMHFENSKTLLVKHKADPNQIVKDRGIAAIHYAAGMDNVQFSDYLMKLILKNNGNPNIQTVDGETPLHIAASWNRQFIVEMLLDHGADVLIEDADNNTAINYAIMEGHSNIIDVFKKHLFEKKLGRKVPLRIDKEVTPTKKLQETMKKSHQLELPQRQNDNNIYTPNRVNYNFDATSPYYVNITHRRKANPSPIIDSSHETVKRISVDPMISYEKAPTDEKIPAINTKLNEKTDNQMTEETISNETDTQSGSNQTIVYKENLFQLTEENLSKHLESFSHVNRLSLVDSWRQKIQSSRKRDSILPSDESDLDSFIAKFIEALSTSQTSTRLPLNDEPQDSVTLNGHANNDTSSESIPNGERFETGTDSFTTALENQECTDQHMRALQPDDSLGEFKKMMKTPNESDEIVVQVENFIHTDNESDIVFYETKFSCDPSKRVKFNNDVDNNLNSSAMTLNSVPSTNITIPLEYDTDDLRRELTMYGEPPGPITKSTKRLYLKKLIKYKRRTNSQGPNGPTNGQINFGKYSVELERTLRTENKDKWQDFIAEYKPLEAKMSDGFQNNQTKRLREGNLKTSFIYLLIDPRISENLPIESQVILKYDAWRRFISSIFYVGKGKCSRPYAHLYDAIKLYQTNPSDLTERVKHQESVKLDRIIDIWKSGKGVICLPVFHNILPVEAYTREAAIIDCIGLKNLTNLKRGDYYGHALSWTMRQRKQLGALLLYKAMHIFLAEGESQLRPDDIKKKGEPAVPTKR